MKDDLGRRMKQDYEDALRLVLPRRAYTVIRIDGRGFHTFTKNLERPYSRQLANALDQAAISLCGEMIGCRFAYGQSDEYSFLLTDFEKDNAPLWFDGNVQKIVSVSASLFTAYFNRAFPSDRIAAFDARVLVISRKTEAEKYFLWRQLDASANSLNMLASAHYPHAEMVGKSNTEKHEMLFAKGINWAKQAVDFKRGRVVRRKADGSGWGNGFSHPSIQSRPGIPGIVNPVVKIESRVTACAYNLALCESKLLRDTGLSQYRVGRVSRQDLTVHRKRQFLNQNIRQVGLGNKARHVVALGNPHASFAVPLRPDLIDTG